MKKLTEKAQQDRDEFEAADSCCSCHLNPPCGHCTHPGNPANQEEDESCWEEVEEEKEYLFTFGYGHAHPNKFVRFFGTYGSARQQMFDAYGPKWAFQYPAEKEEELKFHGITELVDAMNIKST